MSNEEAAVDESAIEPAEAKPEVWPRVVKLKYPVDIGSQRIAELTFRRGRVGDMKGLKLGNEVPTDHLVTIASRMSGQLPKVIEMLDVEDAEEVMDIALDFFVKCLPAGKRRSR